MPSITLTNPVPGTDADAGPIATNFTNLQTLLNGGLDNVNIDASAVLDAVARVGVRKNSAGSTFNRRRINLIEGTGVTLTVADDSANEEVDVTIASTAGTITTLRKTTEKVIGNTTTETDLLNDEITIPGNSFGANGFALIYLSGTYENQTGANRTLRLRVKLGATTIWDSGATGALTAIAVTDRGFTLQAVLANTGTTNSQILMGSSSISGRANATTGTGTWDAPANNDGPTSVEFGGTSAEDTTTGLTFKITAQHDAAGANCIIRMKRAEIIVFNKA